MTRDPGTRPAPLEVMRGLRRVLHGQFVTTLYLLIPVLMRTLPSGCNAADLSSPHLERGVEAGTRTSAGVSTAALALADGPTAPAGALGRHERLPDWVSRSAVRLWRLSAWRNARRSSASVIPARTGSSGAASAACASVPPPRRQAETGPARRLARNPVATVSPATVSTERWPFPIDVVYTWVDDDDPAWRARYAETLETHQREGLHDESASPARFRNRDELRYSLRSLALYAPFVRNVYIVTAGQVAPWLDLDAPNLRLIPHEEILEPDCLPTFNSHAIESALHRIDGLAEHYLYLNDDFFFGRPCHPSMFFTDDGQPRIFPDHRAMVPDGPCSPADRPVDSASKNTREIMDAEFDFQVKYKMQHVPYPQRRSILEEMEQRFPGAFKQTARNPFRHHTDVNIPSCLSHYYAYVTGAAVTDRMPAAYVNISNPWAQLKMRRLLQRADRDVFCLNDCPMSRRRRAVVDSSVRLFLEAYFPEPSPFELISAPASRS